MDETTLTLDPILCACWMKVGKQKCVPTTQPGEKQKRHVFCGCNWKQDTVTWTVANTQNSASSLASLSLFEHRVTLIWLPLYCSDLNPIERFWRRLKDLACASKLQDKIDDVVTSVEKVLNQQNMDLSNSRFLLSKNL